MHCLFFSEESLMFLVSLPTEFFQHHQKLYIFLATVNQVRLYCMRSVFLIIFLTSIFDKHVKLKITIPPHCFFLTYKYKIQQVFTGLAFIDRSLAAVIATILFTFTPFASNYSINFTSNLSRFNFLFLYLFFFPCRITAWFSFDPCNCSRLFK